MAAKARACYLYRFLERPFFRLDDSAFPLLFAHSVRYPLSGV